MFSGRIHPAHPYAGMHHHRQRLPLIWAMVLLLLSQTLIPIQSHTRWSINETGQVIEICTLHAGGALADQDGEGADTQASDRTAAMTFSLLMAAATSGGADLQLAWLALLPRPIPPAVIGTPSRRTPRFAPIRAPPVLG